MSDLKERLAMAAQHPIPPNWFTAYTNWNIVYHRMQFSKDAAKEGRNPLCRCDKCSVYMAQFQDARP